VRLTDEQRQEADRLLLTYTEMSVALATHIAPEVYAQHKAEMQAERDAWDAKMAAMGEAMLESAATCPRRPWQKPRPKDTEDGG
jgi:hypothetical protein